MMRGLAKAPLPSGHLATVKPRRLPDMAGVAWHGAQARAGACGRLVATSALGTGRDNGALIHNQALALGWLSAALATAWRS